MKTACPAALIVGITNATPLVIRQEINPALKCPQQECTPVFEKQTLTQAGGSAYDSRLRGLWITNGLSLSCVDTTGCKLLCDPVNIPLPPTTAQAWCTGLAYVDSGARGSPAGSPGWLFASYNTGHIGRLDVSACSIKAQFCKFSVNDVTIGGLATNDVKRLLFIGTTSATGANTIHVARIDPTVAIPQPWCTPICQFVPPDCTSTAKLGPIQGLAYDACRDMLYITDGKQTTYGVVSVNATSCSIKQAGCCPLVVNTAGDTYTGLCLQPHREEPVGKSCTAPGCNDCSEVMEAVMVGDAVLGNPTFGFALRNAPSNTDAIAFAANIGGCTSPGVNLGYCANIRVPVFGLPLPLTVLFIGIPPTAGTCGRNFTLPAPLPLNPVLCGNTYSFQWVIQCNGNPSNFGVTNCVSFRVSGS
ncbi:MAG: hypothetical protein ACYTKC_02935 [Planctomycetota bacterium]